MGRLALSRQNDYRAALRASDVWEAFLVRESNVPGPRANLELVQAAADVGTLDQFRAWLTVTGGAPDEFLPLCGTVGLGRLVADGHAELLDELRRHAADRRWRVREGVAMGLQRLGARDMARLLEVAQAWSRGSWLEQRAAMAAVCEPALLRTTETVAAVLRLLDAITGGVASASNRKDEGFRVLRQALGYGWSVAIAAAPTLGLDAFERWVAVDDPDVQWIVRENLKKDRLKKVYRAQSEHGQ